MSSPPSREDARVSRVASRVVADVADVASCRRVSNGARVSETWVW